MQQTLTGRVLLTGDGVLEFPVVHVDADGTIASIHSDPRALADETTVLAAGFFDVHTHGAVGVDVMNATAAEIHAMQRFLAQHGVTHYLPTTVTAPVDFTLRALEIMAGVIEGPMEEGEAQPVGVHIEGPFLSHAKRGMHPAEHLQRPSIELFERLQAAARGHVRLMTIAPEPNAIPVRSAGAYEESTVLELIRHASIRGVRSSIGHTNALAAETFPAIEAGAVSATHTFNAMRPLDHREPGVLGAVLDDDRLFADLICDGVHVAPPLVRLWMKAKGAKRGVLITDALSATGMGDGDYMLGSSPVTVRGERALVSEDLAHGKETLAGSVLTMDRAVENLRRFTSAGLEDAVRMASHNPAAMLGATHLTQLSPGSPATLNRFDASGNLLATYVRGREVPR